MVCRAPLLYPIEFESFTRFSLMGAKPYPQALQRFAYLLYWSCTRSVYHALIWYATPCTLTTASPPPEGKCSRGSIAGTSLAVRQRTSVPMEQGARRCGASRSQGGEKRSSAAAKGKPPNCCNSLAARRVSKNTAPICVQCNREPAEAQDFFLCNSKLGGSHVNQKIEYHRRGYSAKYPL